LANQIPKFEKLKKLKVEISRGRGVLEGIILLFKNLDKLRDLELLHFHFEKCGITDVEVGELSKSLK